MDRSHSFEESAISVHEDGIDEVWKDERRGPQLVAGRNVVA